MMDHFLSLLPSPILRSQPSVFALSLFLYNFFGYSSSKKRSVNSIFLYHRFAPPTTFGLHFVSFRLFALVRDLESKSRFFQARFAIFCQFTHQYTSPPSSSVSPFPNASLRTSTWHSRSFAWISHTLVWFPCATPLLLTSLMLFFFFWC
jgi:hypothetical protein